MFATQSRPQRTVVGHAEAQSSFLQFLLDLLQGCLAKVKSGEGLGCIINPEVGRESDAFQKSEESKNIVVVGGGPGGMQAALTAVQRGHNVVLFDEHELGGQFNLSFLPPGKEMMERPLKSLISKVRRSSVVLHLSQKATLREITEENPDVVILATGAAPVSLPIPGLDNALTGEDVLAGKMEVGNRVCIIGGGMVGLEVAEFLSHRKHQVTVVELLDDIARDMEPITRKLTVMGLNNSGIEILTKTKVTRLDGKKVFVESGEKETLLGEFDTVVVAVGTRSVNDLESIIRDAGIEVITIGDARKPGQVYDAVRDGFDIAISI